MVCDWLLDCRTSVWEAEIEEVKSKHGEVNLLTYAAPQGVLKGFQFDLASLRIISQFIPVSPALQAHQPQETRCLFDLFLGKQFQL